MFFLFSLCACFLFASLANAFTPFFPNCTNPPDQVSYVGSASIRGTMDIFWSCFTVLLLCTWTVQHLSVPVHNESKKYSPFGAWKEDVSFFIAKLRWMCISVLAPEYVLGKALTEHIAATDSRRGFKHENWTTTHGYFANMRGFVLRFEIAAVPTSLEPHKQSTLGRSLWKIREGDSPYEEQDIKYAEDIELDQCHKICGIPCRNRDVTVSTKESGVTSESPLKAAVLDSRNKTTAPRSPSTPWSDTLDTAVGPQGFASPSTPRRAATLERIQLKSPSTTKGLPSDRRFIAQVDVHDFVPPSIANGTGVVMQAQPEPLSIETGGPQKGTSFRPEQLQSPQTSAKPSDPQNGTPVLPDQTHPTPSLPKTLGPHKPWKGTWALNSIQLLYAYQTGIIPHPPPITTSELSDRSKGDALLKLAAIMQITWLVMQIIARAFQNLAITLLEITVLALAACAITTYLLLLHKPQDVHTPVYIDASQPLTRAQVVGLAARSPVSTLMVHEFWLHGVAVHAMADNVFPWTRGIAMRLPGTDPKHPVFLNPIFLGFGVGGALFGAVHFVAWNFAFPTPVERLLWRVACGILTGVPSLGAVLYFAMQHVARTEGVLKDAKINQILRPLFHGAAVLYLLARLYLLAEVFRSLAFAPASSFLDVAWPSVIPHAS